MADSQATQHIPVLYQEVLNALKVVPGGLYLDGTLGAGGHAKGILEASAPNGQLLGLDADSEAVTFANSVLASYAQRTILVTANFSEMAAVASDWRIEKVDGILLDLGISSRQLSNPDRGFAFSQSGPLDMRMNRQHGPTAADLISELSEDELADIIWRYGEERHSRRIARAIVSHRPLSTTKELANLVSRTQRRGGKGPSRKTIHPATRTFQALRIAVNDELQALDAALPLARDLLRPGARLAVISFHSLEDRLVKQFFVRESKDCICPPEVPICVCDHQATMRIITRKPIRPSQEEVDHNPRSRSAKLRVAERLPFQAGPQ